MKRTMLLLGLLAGLAASASAQSRTYYGFQLNIGDAPPPPRVYFRQPPQVRFEPRSRVYVVANDVDYGVDLFRYGRFWYMTRDGYWYRARNYRGPYRVIDPRNVPRAIFYVPASEWRYRPREGGPRDRVGHNDGDNGGRDRGYDNRNDYDRDTYFGFHVDVSNAPPPPRIYWRNDPDVVYVPESGSYVVVNSDYDMFRYGDYWYVSSADGYWYRSRNYRGPFQVIDARSVPEAIYDTPDRHWKHRPMRGEGRDRARSG
jgi:hypothetical protein